MFEFFKRMEGVHCFQLALGISFTVILIARYFYLQKKQRALDPLTQPVSVAPPKKQKNKKNKNAPPAETLASLRKSTVVLRPKNRFDFDPVIASFALLAVLSYYSFGSFHGGGTFIHIWDFFHYYMGSKYSKELGYSNLYNCVVTAEIVDGENLQKNLEIDQALLKKEEKNSQKRKYLFERQKAIIEHINYLKQVEMQRLYVRNLDTYSLKSAEEIKVNREKYIQLFSPKRWEEFRNDLWFFRFNVSCDRWGMMLRDHGYNPSPVWNTTGTFFSNTAGTFFSNRDAFHIRILVLLDPLLLLIAAVAIYFSFGLRTFMFVLLIFGLNFPSRLFWTGGSFLRQGWLFCSILGICCLRKKKYNIAGIFFAYAFLVRVFPLFFLAGPGMKAFGCFLRKRQIPKRYWQLFLSFFLTSLILVGYGCLSGLGAQNWKFFIEKIKLHSKQNLTNNVGLKPILLYEGETTHQDIHSERIQDELIRALDPFLAWEQSRQKKFEHLKIVYYGIFVFIFLLFSTIVQKKNDVDASILGIILLFTGVNLTCYYYSMLLFIPILLNRSNKIEKNLRHCIFLALLVLTQTLSLLVHYYFYTSFFIGIYFYVSLFIAIYLYSYLGIECFILFRRGRKHKHDSQPI